MNLIRRGIISNNNTRFIDPQRIPNISTIHDDLESKFIFEVRDSFIKKDPIESVY